MAMTSSPEEDELINAQLELDAISSSDSHRKQAEEASVNIQAAIKMPSSRDSYLDEAETIIRQLKKNLDPDGPYYVYAKNADEYLSKA